MRFVVVVAVSVFLAGSVVSAADKSQPKMDQIFAAYEKPGSPGCAVGVIQNGSFAYRKGYGMGSLELGVPLSSQSVFYVASVSKQFTAASVVLAAEQGFLTLDRTRPVQRTADARAAFAQHIFSTEPNFNFL